MIVRELLIKLGLKTDRGDFRKAERGVERVREKAMETANATAGMASSLGGMFAALGGLAAATFAGKWLVESISSMEALKTSLISVTGSVEEADKAFDLIREFAGRTPFQMEEVANSFRKLEAQGLDASLPALEAYGNTAAAMGKSLDQMVEAVADAAVGEFERLKEFGIKASSQGNKVKFTFRGVTTTVKKDAAAIQGYLQEVGRVQFAGGMERQSKTLQGLWSTLKDTMVAFAMGIGEAGLLDALHDMMEIIFKANKAGPTLATVIGFLLTNAVRALNMLLEGGINIVSALADAWNTIFTPETTERLAEFKEELLDIGRVLLLTVSPLLVLFLLVDDFVAFLQGRKSVIGRFVDEFREAPGVLGMVARGLEAIKDPTFWTEMLARAEAFWASMKAGAKAIETAWDRYVALIKETWQTIVSFNKSVNDAVPIYDTMVSIVESLSAAWEEVAPEVEGVTDAAEGLGERIWRLAEIASAVTDAIVGGFVSVLEAFGLIRDDMVDTVPWGKLFDWLDTAWSAFVAQAKKTAVLFAAVVTAVVKDVLGQIETAIVATNKVLDVVIKALENMPAIAKMAWQGFLDWLENNINMMVKVVNELISAANKVPGIDIGRVGKVNLTGGGAGVTAGGGGGGFFSPSAIMREVAMTSNVGTVNVTIEGSTDMGPDEVKDATSQGVEEGMQMDPKVTERAFAFGQK